MKPLLSLVFVVLSVLASTACRGEDPERGDGRKPEEMLLGGIYTGSAWMGDAADPACDGVLRFSQDDKNTVVASSSDRWEYRPAKGKVNWVAVGYTWPVLNFGEKPGKDLYGRGFRKLVFYARGRDGGEKIIFKAMGGTPPDARHKASADEISLDAVTLTTEWKRVVIKLGDHADLSNVPTSLTWATNADLNPDGCVFFIEGLKFTD